MRRLALGLAVCSVVAAAIVACGGGTAHAGACGDLYVPPTFDPDAPQILGAQPPLSNFDRGYAAWLRSPEVRSLSRADLAGLRRFETFGDGPGGWPNFECAVDRAEVVVVGTVERLHYLPDRTLTDFRVERIAKGQVPTVISLLQYSSLFPEKGQFPSGPFGSPTIQDEPGAPLLLAGDRALLLLDRTRLGPEIKRLVPNADAERIRYTTQDQSGQYLITDGRAQALATNPIRDVDGRTEQQLFDRARAEAGRRS
jgi:hypothetical protein